MKQILIRVFKIWIYFDRNHFSEGNFIFQWRTSFLGGKLLHGGICVDKRFPKNSWSGGGRELVLSPRLGKSLLPVIPFGWIFGFILHCFFFVDPKMIVLQLSQALLVHSCPTLSRNITKLLHIFRGENIFTFEFLLPTKFYAEFFILLIR